MRNGAILRIRYRVFQDWILLTTWREKEEEEREEESIALRREEKNFAR